MEKVMKISDICRDFEEWPDSWEGESRDKEYGERICMEMKPFIEALIEKGLTKETIKRHMDYLWLLGGEIIREVNMHREYTSGIQKGSTPKDSGNDRSRWRPSLPPRFRE